MSSTQNHASPNISHEERAFCARLAAMNTMFEAARAGSAGKNFCHRAQSSDELLLNFLEELKPRQF